MLTIYIPSRAARNVRGRVPVGSGIVGRPAPGGGVLIEFDDRAEPGNDRAQWERNVLHTAEQAANGGTLQHLEVPEHELIPVGIVDESLRLSVDGDDDVDQSITGWLASADG